MATLEQVEKLREKANVSYEDAKAALDATGGDLLEAMIYLEKQGKVHAPDGNGYYSSEKSSGESKNGAGAADGEKDPGRGRKEKETGETFGDIVKRFLKFCCKVIHLGNINSFEVYKDGESKASFPITVLVLLLVFMFWVTLPLIIIGLFFGLRYRFCGPNFKKSAVNSAMDNAADAAESFKNSFRENHKDSD